jgi:hypothetical protein
MATASSGSLTAYMFGVLGSSGVALNMYLACDRSTSSGNINLYLEGSSSGATYYKNNITAYLHGEAMTTNLNMFIQGTGTWTSGSSLINLYLLSNPDAINNSITGTIWGYDGSGGSSTAGLVYLTLDELESLSLDELEQLELDSVTGGDDGYGIRYVVNNNVTMYIAGDGVADGYVPSGSYMNMFIKAPSGTNNSVNCFIRGNGPSSSYTNLYTCGISGVATSGMNMYTRGTDTYNKNLNMFIRGYNNI